MIITKTMTGYNTRDKNNNKQYLWKKIMSTINVATSIAFLTGNSLGKNNKFLGKLF